MPKDSISDYTLEHMLLLPTSVIARIANSANQEEAWYKTYSDREIEMAQAIISWGED